MYTVKTEVSKSQLVSYHDNHMPDDALGVSLVKFTHVIICIVDNQSEIDSIDYSYIIKYGQGNSIQPDLLCGLHNYSYNKHVEIIPLALVFDLYLFSLNGMTNI